MVRWILNVHDSFDSASIESFDTAAKGGKQVSISSLSSFPNTVKQFHSQSASFQTKPSYVRLHYRVNPKAISEQ